MSSSAAPLAPPPLPAYTLKPVTPLVPGVPDVYLALFLPILTFWTTSFFYEWLDARRLFSRYKIHTPAEILKRNHVSKSDVIKTALFQQFLQVTFGLLLDDAQDYTGDAEFRVALWASRIRVAQGWIPALLALLGVDAQALAKRIAPGFPILAGGVAGGIYPNLLESIDLDHQQGRAPAFATWEIVAAKLLYHVVIPAFQFSLAVFLADTWQYFTHRAMHVNKWLYRNIHAMHHRLYAPYAYGAFYNHPLETFVVDMLGLPFCLKLAGLTTRQATCYYALWTIKTVNDHAGYVFPWDPFKYVTSNNPAFHDLHHQNWGLKYNFSVYLTFWDRVFGTLWTEDASSRYERGRAAAEFEVQRQSQEGKVLKLDK